jgi:CubicO group peptidase (beta-lactamase class C family)
MPVPAHAGVCRPRPRIADRSAIAVLALSLLLAGCAAPPRVPVGPAPAVIDSEAWRLMQHGNVNGLAIAVIDGGQVMHVAAYGQRNVERGLPLTTDTILYGASLTKTAFAHLVLQLVDDGRLDLDASIATLLPRPLPEYEDYADLAGDERWRALTPRMLLNHTSGFANLRWLEPDQKLRFHFDPGSRYAYSGEGFYLLQVVLEQGLGIDVGAAMQARVFDRFSMGRSSMQWRDDFAEDLADGYALDGTMEPHDERSSVSASGSMDTTIHDQALLWAGIVRGDGLSAAARAEMTRPQVPITSLHQFPSLMAERGPDNAAVGLAAGLGLVTFRDTTGPAWFKGGHNDWTGNFVICLERGQRCVVLMSNDVRAERLYPDLVRLVLGQTRMPWAWEYSWADTRRSGE